ncbi:MAG: manganese efflux pump [Bacteroidales bacterium]|nr:manganese efflux pump [Bacteroidales bacterium]
MFRSIILALLLALSLCADCFAVSLCSGVTMQDVRRRQVVFIALIFGIVQAGLLLAGYLFGDLFVGYVEKFAHWIGFLLLLYVGGSMVLEALSGKQEARDLNGIRNIVVASIATSIDALAVGISLSMDMETLPSALLKGAAVFLVTVLSVVTGIIGGRRIGTRFGRKAEFAGGCVLILIGLNILLGIV